ncbi:MAG: DNA primase family protein, partial [Sporomusa sp.]
MAKDNVIDFANDDEKKELLKAKRQQETEEREVDIFRVLAQLEELPADKRLLYYRESVFPLLKRLRPTEQAVSIKRVAKALNIGSKAIRQELRDEYDRDEGKALWFDEEGSFIPPVLSDYLLSQHNLVCDRHTIFVYINGIYRPEGVPFIKSECLKLLGEAYRDMHGNEVVKYIETKGWEAKGWDADAILDVDPKYINLNNGLLDWMADPPTLLSHTPEYKSSIRIPVTYNPEAVCPRIEQFFRDTCPEDAIDLVYELFGYCLVPDTRFHKAFMLLGDGENGKSTFISLLEAFIGARNCSSESLQNLDETTNKFRMANLAGKLVNIYADLPTKRMEETSTFKSLVSGDMQSAERKGEKSFSFKNFARLVFGANKLP